MGYVFYDTETTGVEAAFDQILQFAAIHTDDEINEIERFEIRSRLSPYVVPAAQALLVNGISAKDLVDPSLPSQYEMAQEISRRFQKWGPAVFLGYNSISFDEVFLRHAFYRSLLPIFATNTNKNCRADVLRLVHGTSFLAPDALQVPEDASGQRTFRLSEVTKQNDIAHPLAHHAMGDVEATVNLARLLANRAPDVWSQMLRFVSKAAVVDFLEYEEAFVIGEYGFRNPKTYLATGIGPLPSMPTRYLAFDLSVDPDGLLSLDDEDLSKALAKSPKVIRRVRTNEFPVLIGLDGASGIVAEKGVKDKELARRAGVVKKAENRERLTRLTEAAATEYPPSPFVEGQIYEGGFYSNGDVAKQAAFHRAPWADRPALVDRMEDRRLRILGRRLLYVERPDCLPDEIRAKLAARLKDRLTTTESGIPWRTLPAAVEEFDKEIEQASDEDRGFLEHHRAALVARMEAFEKTV